MNYRNAVFDAFHTISLFKDLVHKSKNVGGNILFWHMLSENTVVLEKAVALVRAQRPRCTAHMADGRVIEAEILYPRGGMSLEDLDAVLEEEGLRLATHEEQDAIAEELHAFYKKFDEEGRRPGSCFYHISTLKWDSEKLHKRSVRFWGKYDGVFETDTTELPKNYVFRRLDTIIAAVKK